MKDTKTVEFRPRGTGPDVGDCVCVTADCVYERAVAGQYSYHAASDIDYWGSPPEIQQVTSAVLVDAAGEERDATTEECEALCDIFSEEAYIGLFVDEPDFDDYDAED